MANKDYLKIKIGENTVEVFNYEDLPISIDYSLEDPENFENKQSSQSLDLIIPATLSNDIATNTFRNASVQDMTDDSVYTEPQRVIVECNSWELLVGKAYLKKFAHDSLPTSYKYNLFGDNADWLIDLKEKTLYDFLKQISFTFSKAQIQTSWNYNGRNEELPYVFAPIRYRESFGGNVLRTGTDELIPDDENVLPTYLKPSISKYYLVYWGFKSLGYKIKSEFLDTDFFRRQVMPWVWGSFLDSDSSRLDSHDFMAQTLRIPTDYGTRYDEFWDRAIHISSPDNNIGGIVEGYLDDFRVSNDSTEGSFDNNDDYSWDDGSKEMIWKYKDNKPFGTLEAHLSVIMDFDASRTFATDNSSLIIRVDWFKNDTSGEPLQSDTVLDINAGWVTQDLGGGQIESFFFAVVDPGDKIIAKIWRRGYKAKYGEYSTLCRVAAFQLNYFRIPIGGVIDFVDYTGLQKSNWVDYFRGLVDEYNLSINTDSINKIVIIEPTHPYRLPGETEYRKGYFNGDYVDWNGKEDISKQWEMDLYSNEEKESLFSYKDDSNDGILKLIQDRHILRLTRAKYLFPDRFLSGTKERENRFFSATMHYFVQQWKNLGTGANVGIATQIPCIIPENVSQTSERESNNTFSPKSCYYKGLVNGVGAWKFDGDVLQDFPYMFSVNYRPGGQNDPVLSYCDERIGGNGEALDGVENDALIAQGLLKRFYWQRLAIMRNGLYYTTWFKLNNSDIANQFHREYKSYNGDRWALINIKSFKPLLKDSVQCLMYKWSPISKKDSDATFPTESSVLDGELDGESDVSYNQLICLTSDIPV